jgi:iron complex transport system substrate-binding protein
MVFLRQSIKALSLMRILPYLLLFLLLNGCQLEKHEESASLDNSSIKYATGFTIEQYKGYRILELHDPWRGEKTNHKYLLYKGEEPEGYDSFVKIKVPIKSIACMSLTHIAFLESLGVENSIVAASGCRYSSSSKFTNLVSENSIIEVGSEQSINYEILIDRKPDIVMAYGIDETSNKQVNKLKTIGLTPVLNAEYMETHPLGKAEWLKFVAAFYNLDDKADSIFSYIENEYEELRKIIPKTIARPTVFVGMPWNGNWYVAGGESFQAALLKDAGADYLWKNNNEKSSVIKSKEFVIDDAFEADFWINQNSYNSIEEIASHDERLIKLKAMQNAKLFNNNKRLNSTGGNDYWESGTVRPHIILKDLIEIFHPELVDHNLYYYKELE